MIWSGTVEDEIVLEVGETFPRYINGKLYTITLTTVEENSLCPKTLYCFWGGRIIVELKINRADFKLGNGDDKIPSELIFGNMKVKIIDENDYRNDNPQMDQAKV